ncbi:MAG: hypothetical protein WB611_21705 [Stellaceae bacterium]
MMVETGPEKFHYGAEEKVKNPACAKLNSKGSAGIVFMAMARSHPAPKHLVTGRLPGVRFVRGGGPDPAG